MEEQKKRRYISGFDGLRALGVLGVILYHLRPDIYRGGYLGVPIFMVVSGYLITDGLVMEFARTHRFDFRSFWQRRIRRLYPGLVLMLVGTSAFITIFARGLLHNLHEIVLSNLTYVYNWWQIANGQSYFAHFAQGDSPFTHLWTLAIEGQFYLIWPLIMFFLYKKTGADYKKRGFQVAFGLAILSAILMAVLYRPQAGIPYDPSRLYYGTDTRVFSILVGAALAFVWPSARLAKKIGRSDKIILNITGAVALALILVMVIFTTDQSRFLYRGGMFIFSLLVTILVAVVAHPGASFNRLLTNPVFSWIGRRSYGLYLYQLPVMVFVERFAKNLADHQIMYAVIEVGLIVLITELSYRFVERPIAKAQFTRTRMREYLHELQNNRRKLVRVSVLALVTLIGLVGILQAPTVQAQPDSPLAKQLTDSKAKKAQKARRLADLKKNLESSQQESKAQPAKSVKPAKTKPKATTKTFTGQLTAAESKRAKALAFTAVGDSVMKDGELQLEQLFPKAFIDAVPSRQVSDGIAALQSYAKQGALAPTLLIGLGTNGPLTADLLRSVMNIAGQGRQVYWINVRVPTKSWQNTTNATLKAGAKEYANLHVIDWFDYANQHETWFYKDRVHPNPDGTKKYAQFVAHNLVQE